ncbi:MAG: hypothetical protein WBC86_05250, partial [Pseudolabrys sp.]
MRHGAKAGCQSVDLRGRPEGRHFGLQRRRTRGCDLALPAAQPGRSNRFHEATMTPEIASDNPRSPWTTERVAMLRSYF